MWSKVQSLWNHKRVVEIRKTWIWKATAAFLSLAALALIIAAAAYLIIGLGYIAPTIAAGALVAAKWCVILFACGLVLSLAWQGVKVVAEKVHARIDLFQKSRAAPAANET
jgi:hypothetical protein